MELDLKFYIEFSIQKSDWVRKGLVYGILAPVEPRCFFSIASDGTPLSPCFHPPVYSCRFGVKYPANGVRECYVKALEERGLTEACFSSSSQRVFSLGGMYRRCQNMEQQPQCFRVVNPFGTDFDLNLV